ncbi:1-deoxypentalenic acid 11-beta-hydroxylase [Roseovarius albus]|uniref:1-deoxypentalenic acid 11-beta-hydroxylase n=1 Tax=Roseovarius albus TaxID=1247867 RepID=A0A1X6Z5W9_9RHOB|nr:phytanoyl-CoA dioxygenase family protein [Roseovarius albus]SLN41189.1 1-deoxypentalenic acid 11-beta-hydroxylase [Roseovarius albus]
MSKTTSQPALSQEQIASFEKNGFLAMPDLIDPADLLEIEEEYAALLDDVAHQLHAEGKVKDTMAHLEFGDRYSALVAEYPDLHRYLNVSLPLLNEGIDPETFHMHSGPAVFHLMRHPKILDVVEQFIGPEISSSPVQQMRMKPPEKAVHEDLKGHSNVGATTWHQDIVALLPEADDTTQVTVWLAITEATIENGCLASVPASHSEGPKVHCSNLALASEPQVPDKVMADREAVPLPVNKGGIVLFHKMNVHRALPNLSDGLRWSVDLRYLPTGQPTGRPAFPGFVARSRANPESELRDATEWAASWDKARENILSGHYKGRIFEDTRWNDAAVC